MTSERSVEASIVRFMDTIGYGVKIHGDAYSVHRPDRLYCVKGRTVVIEVKAPGQEPRPGQYAELRKWRAAGALAFWADSLKKVKRHLEFAGLI